MKYEEAIAKLEQIARQLEQNQLPIDQIAAQLREAQELVKYCREQLTSVDEEIKKIVGEETAEWQKSTIFPKNPLYLYCFYRRIV